MLFFHSFYTHFFLADFDSSISTMVLKLVPLRHLWKRVLTLCRTSNMNLIKTHIVKHLFIDEATQSYRHH